MTPAILAVAPSDMDLEHLLAVLSLANTRKNWAELARRAETESWSYRDFLAIVCAEEVSHRRQTRMQKDTRHAGFPFLKTIDDFDVLAVPRTSLDPASNAPPAIVPGVQRAWSPPWVVTTRCLPTASARWPP